MRSQKQQPEEDLLPVDESALPPVERELSPGDTVHCPGFGEQTVVASEGQKVFCRIGKEPDLRQFPRRAIEFVRRAGKQS